MTDVTVCIPSIPPRAKLLERAMRSVAAQSHPVVAVSVAVDHAKEGAATTRNRALDGARTEWVVFLDDDDELHVPFVARCLEHAAATDADVVFPWFDVIGGADPFPANRGVQFDPEHPHSFPITTLVRRSCAEAVGGFPNVGAGPPGEIAAGEDFRFWNLMGQSGARVEHLDEVLWSWHHDSGNVGGRPDRW